MPQNKNLKPVQLPMDLKFGQEPKTLFYNNLEHLQVELIDAPTRSQALNVAWQYVKATWADHHDNTNPGTASLQELSANLEDVLNFRALPTPMECLGFTFKLSGLSFQEVTHIIRHRAGSFAAQCTGDRDLRNDNALIPESIENCTENDDFYFRYISLVAQDITLFDDTIRNNILYANPDASNEELNQAVKFSYSKEFIEKLPNKFETLIGENGIRLSGGEKQRISIARAMLKKSSIILLDEATSSLDSDTETKIQEAIKLLTNNKTTLVIAHRLSTIKNSKKIYVIDDGKIVADGNHENLLKNSEIYKNFYEKQLRKD